MPARPDPVENQPAWLAPGGGRRLTVHQGHDAFMPTVRKPDLGGHVGGQARRQVEVLPRMLPQADFDGAADSRQFQSREFQRPGLRLDGRSQSPVPEASRP